MAVNQALQEFGRLDILVNNAGAPGSLDRTLVVDLAEEAWDTVLDTNLKGTFLCSQSVARTMLERGVRGRIISLSSQWGKKGGARRAAYCASKFGIIGFTQSLAQELASAGIAEVAAFLAGDRAEYITGQSINVTGGGVMH
jgi:3-oxoacyl-[acyl-carrier protein] reductase